MKNKSINKILTIKNLNSTKKSNLEISNLLKNKVNNNSKIIPLNYIKYNNNEFRYSPPVNKEWRNSVYNYYSPNNLNYPVYDKNLYFLLKGFFNLSIKKNFLKKRATKKIGWRALLFSNSIKKKRAKDIKPLKKILISKGDIKHTNNKAIITIYIYNKERKILLLKLKNLLKNFYKFIYWYKFSILNNFINNHKDKNLQLKWFNLELDWSNIIKMKKLDIKLRKNNLKTIKILEKIQKKIQIYLLDLRRFRLKFSINKLKYEDKFLSIMANLIEKYYSKKIDFNLVHLKNYTYNSDIFTQILERKLQNPFVNPLKIINSLVSKFRLANDPIITEKTTNKFNRYVNISSQINSKYSTSLLSNDLITKMLNSIYSENKEFSLIEEKNSFTLSSYLHLRNILLENVNYKVLSGVKFRVKGRLTRRVRADRAKHYVVKTGRINNNDLNQLSGTVFRGYIESNVEKSTLTSKRKVGSYGIVSWLSGKQ